MSSHSGFWMALGASVSLLFFFYFPAMLSMLGLASVCLAGFLGLSSTLDPLLSLLLSDRLSAASSLVSRQCANLCSGCCKTAHDPPPRMVVHILSVVIICSWFLWQHWLLNNGASNLVPLS